MKKTVLLVAALLALTAVLLVACGKTEDEMESTAKDAVSEMSSDVSRDVSDAGDKVGDVATGVGDAVGDVVTGAVR